MPLHLCARCQNAIAPSEGSLSYCPFCGAPQVFLPEPLREQADGQARQFAESQQPARTEAAADGSTDLPLRPSAIPLEPGGIAWPLAVRCAAMAGLAALVLGLLGMALPFLVLLSLLWAVLAPAVAVRLYGSKLPDATVTAQFGARLGLLTALFVCLANTIVSTFDRLLMRFVLHQAGPLDAQMQALWTQMLASQTGPGADAFAAILHIPEFRVGFILAGAALSGLFYLLITSLIGALAGQMRPAAAARR